MPVAKWVKKHVHRKEEEGFAVKGLLRKKRVKGVPVTKCLLKRRTSLKIQ